MKSIVGKILGRQSRAFLELVSVRRFGLNRPTYLASLDKVLEAYNKSKNGKIHFVQVGSNDGMSGDPLHPYIRHNQWRGILVEPMESVFGRLVENYKQESERLFFAKVAIGTVDGNTPFYYVDDPNRELPEWASQLSSFNREVIEKHRVYFPGIETRIREKPIETLRFDSLLRRYDFNTVDLVHIDTEGSDYDTLKTINFDQISPDIIIYEQKHIPVHQVRESVRFLKDRGYKLFICKGDCLALKMSLSLKF